MKDASSNFMDERIDYWIYISRSWY